MSWKLSPDKYRTALANVDPVRVHGQVVQVIGLTVESIGPDVRIGELCTIFPSRDAPPVRAEVVGFRHNRVLLMPLGELGAVGPGCDVVATGQPLTAPTGPQLLGRVLNGLGEPIDDGPPLHAVPRVPVDRAPPSPLERPPVAEPVGVGVRVIDGLLTVGRGQRVGIFAGSGVGKSTLLGMVARNTEADVNVIALIGERGREVRAFLERDLGPEGLARSVVVVATSDQPALIRIKGALVATAIAEAFRDQGRDVMLLMDSVTRYAMALREVGLAVGEPPTTKGYTPSVFAALPRLLERAGTSAAGTITAFYTVLVDGDDLNDPIADAVRGILDGHIVLDRALANRGHFPAVDVLASTSRVMRDIVSADHMRAAENVRRVLALHKDAEDLLQIGAYKRGTNRELDIALQHIEAVRRFTRQSPDEAAPFPDTTAELIQRFKEIGL